MVYDPRRDVKIRFAAKYSKAAEYANTMLGGFSSDADTVKDIATQTGIISLDIAMGGGIPSGITEIYGDESVGKTSLGASIIRRSQDLGLTTLLCASELVDLDYLSGMGVDLGALALARGPMDYSLETVADFLFEPKRVAVVDSITALRPVNDTFENRDRILSGFLDEMRSSVPIGSALIVISQVRAERSIEPGKQFTGRTESAERWMTEFFDTRMEVARTEVSEDAYTMKVTLVKSILSPPMTMVEIPAVKGQGADVDLDRLQAAVSSGIIERRGSSYFMGPVHLGAGSSTAARTVKNNEAIREAVINQLLKGAKLV